MIRVAAPRWRNAASALDLMDGWSERAASVWFRLLMHASLYGQDVLAGQAFATATGLQAGRAMTSSSAWQGPTYSAAVGETTVSMAVTGPIC